MGTIITTFLVIQIMTHDLEPVDEVWLRMPTVKACGHMAYGNGDHVSFWGRMRNPDRQYTYVTTCNMIMPAKLWLRRVLENREAKRK